MQANNSLVGFGHVLNFGCYSCHNSLQAVDKKVCNVCKEVFYCSQLCETLDANHKLTCTKGDPIDISALEKQLRFHIDHMVVEESNRNNGYYFQVSVHGQVSKLSLKWMKINHTLAKSNPMGPQKQKNELFRHLEQASNNTLIVACDFPNNKNITLPFRFEKKT